MVRKVLVKPRSPSMPWQKYSAMGGVAAFVDAEHALDPIYASALGVDIKELLVSQPDTGEMGLEVVDQLVRSAAIDLVVVDSVAALVPRAEIEGEMGDAHVGLQARLDESGVEENYRQHRQISMYCRFPQSVAAKNWHFLRQSRNHHWR
jgi:protein RecA